MVSKMYLKVRYIEKRNKSLYTEQKLYINKETKVTKGTRGMPWLSEAMKDVVSCEKLRGLAHTN